MSVAFKLTPELNETAARWMIVLLVVALAATAADVTWKVVPGATTVDVVTPLPAAPAGGADALDARRLAEQIAVRHLFGIAGAQVATTPAQPVRAPETRLRLTLRGVVANENAESARAIIAAADGQENPYAVGQDVPGGAKLNEIRADSVLLERAGRLEVLTMPRDSVGEGISELPSNTSDATPLPGSGGDVLGDLSTRPLREIRDALVANPEAVNRLLRVVPIQQGGEFKGFRVMAGSQTHLLERLGFQRGDIVTAVNGVALDNPIKGLEAVRQITEAQSGVEVTVMRNGTSQVLNISLE